MSVTIFHNPRCSKSRQTLELLKEKGLEPRIVEYLKTPPSRAELEALLERLGRLHDELDLTVIHVTHDPQEAAGIADREVRMRAGALVTS